MKLASKKIEAHKGAGTMNDIVSKDKNKRGRPTKSAQADIQRQLRPYYQKSISAYTTAKLTGIDIKTVCRYFNKWYRDIMESEERDFIQRCKQQKEQCVLAYDTQIYSLNEDKDELDKLIQNLKRSGNLSLMERLYNLKLKVTEKICSFVAAKTNLINVPTMDTIINLKKKESEKKEGEKNGGNKSK